ncbi:hypothetical protein FD754_007428 [Muntiacus muntjak]|uniref:Uncharacterized protein n=1 Tax=Muntiacus muntjak TaxID=9888 RepID=A0A5N3WN90_MUNMU|nr:hypothetical protein FD754_007428 [Muntiacus muntjak]
MISVKRNTWRALSLVIGDCRKKGNFEYCQGAQPTEQLRHLSLLRLSSYQRTVITRN